jgi:hypothetical protein
VGDRRGDGGDERSAAPLFGPAAGMRVLADVQRRGLVAAGELVDRLIGAVDGDHDGGDAAGTPTPLVPGADPLTTDIVSAWVHVFQRGLQTMAAAARRDGPGTFDGEQIVTADLARGTVTGALHIQVAAHHSPDNGIASPARDRAGRTGSAEVWLHNGTAEPMTGLRPHSGDLRAHNGSTLPESALRFDPPWLDDLAGRSSRGVVVVVEAADGVPGGMYRGVLLVAGAPDVWLPIVVSVASAE